jgi:hypothetical protein
MSVLFLPPEEFERRHVGNNDGRKSSVVYLTTLFQ